MKRYSDEAIQIIDRVAHVLRVTLDKSFPLPEGDEAVILQTALRNLQSARTALFDYRRVHAGSASARMLGMVIDALELFYRLHASDVPPGRGEAVITLITTPLRTARQYASQLKGK